MKNRNTLPNIAKAINGDKTDKSQCISAEEIGYVKAMMDGMIAAMLGKMAGRSRAEAERLVWELWQRPRYSPDIIHVDLTVGDAEAIMRVVFPATEFHIIKK